MKLDIDFAIQIMEAMENSDKPIIEAETELLEGVEFTDERFNYHCLMLNQARLIDIWPQNRTGSHRHYTYIEEGYPVIRDRGARNHHRIIAFPMILTYDGHKFLETIRNEDARGKIRDFLAEHGLPFALSTVKEVGLKFLTG